MSRGQSIIPWLVRGAMTIFVVGIIAGLISAYTGREPSAPSLERGTYLYRLYYGDVIMYADPVTKRIYPGIVDYDKATTERLDTVFAQERVDASLNAKITITPLNCPFPEKTIYNHESIFKVYEPLAISGPGGTTKETLTLPVTIRKSNAECGGTLSITVVRLNS